MCVPIPNFNGKKIELVQFLWDQIRDYKLSSHFTQRSTLFYSYFICLVFLLLTYPKVNLILSVTNIFERERFLYSQRFYPCTAYHSKQYISICVCEYHGTPVILFLKVISKRHKNQRTATTECHFINFFKKIVFF